MKKKEKTIDGKWITRDTELMTPQELADWDELERLKKQEYHEQFAQRSEDEQEDDLGPINKRFR